MLTFERQLSLAEGEWISRTSQQDVGERACRDRDVPSQPVRQESQSTEGIHAVDDAPAASPGPQGGGDWPPWGAQPAQRESETPLTWNLTRTRSGLASQPQINSAASQRLHLLRTNVHRGRTYKPLAPGAGGQPGLAGKHHGKVITVVKTAAGRHFTDQAFAGAQQVLRLAELQLA